MPGKIVHDGFLILPLLLLALLALAPVAGAQQTQTINVTAGETGDIWIYGCNTHPTWTSLQVVNGTEAASWTQSYQRYLDMLYDANGNLTTNNCGYVPFWVEVPAGTAPGTYVLQIAKYAPDSSGVLGARTLTDTYIYNIRVSAVATSTTVNYTYTTINYTTTINSGGCPTGEVLSVLNFCYEPGMGVVESGSASVVDLSGNPASNFTVNTSAVTGDDGRIVQSGAGFAREIGPATTVYNWGVTYSATNGDSVDTTGLTGVNEAGKIMLKQIRKGLNELKNISVFDSAAERAERTAKALMYLKTGVIKIEGIWYNGAESAISHDMGAFPTGTAYVMNATVNGTTFSLYNGTAVIVSVATSNSTPVKYVTLGAGERIFIPSNQTLADRQNLTDSVETFQTASTTTVPQSSTTTIPQNSAGGSSGVEAIIAIFAMIALALLLYYSRRKRKRVKS